MKVILLLCVIRKDGDLLINECLHPSQEFSQHSCLATLLPDYCANVSIVTQKGKYFWDEIGKMTSI